MKQQWQQWLVSKDEMILKELCRNSHNLAGSAGTFGFSSMGQLSRELEKMLTSMQSDAPDRNQLDVVTATMSDIEQLSRNQPDIIYQVHTKVR